MTSQGLVVQELQRIAWLLVGLHLVVAGAIIPDWRLAVYVGFAVSLISLVLPEPVLTVPE